MSMFFKSVEVLVLVGQGGLRRSEIVLGKNFSSNNERMMMFNEINNRKKRNSSRDVVNGILRDFLLAIPPLDIL